MEVQPGSLSGNPPRGETMVSVNEGTTPSGGTTGDGAGAAGTAPLLELRKISKRFGPVQALTDVDLVVPAGQVTALCGDNGAGKSVLIKCIAGIHTPDGGQIFWDGRPVSIRTPRDSERLGIETVYQDLALCDNL